jgi:hypothetical protein
MNSSWKGQLFVIPQGDETCLIGLALPEGVHAEGSFLLFDGEGPMPPTGFPAMQKVPNLKQWMAEKVAAGFSFTPVIDISDGGGN